MRFSAAWRKETLGEKYLGLLAEPLGEIRFDLLGIHCAIACENMFSGAHDRAFDKVFAQVPFGQRANSLQLSGTPYERCARGESPLGRVKSADWIFAKRVCDSLVKNGRAVVVMANGATFNQGDWQARRYFVNEGLVEAVIALPSNLFYSTGIPATMVVFCRGKDGVRMVDATDLSVPGRRRNSIGPDEITELVHRLKHNDEMSAFVAKDDIARHGYSLAPHRYLQDEIELENPTKLGSVATSIERGVALSAKELDKAQTNENTGFSYLPVSALADGRVGTELPHLVAIDAKYEKARLRSGDIVITRNASPLRVLVTEIPEGEKVVATGNLFIIRLDTNRVDPHYVAAFLVSDRGRQLVSRRMTGTSIPTIGLSELKEVELPLLSMEVQRQVARRYQAVLDEIEVLKIKMEKALAAAEGAFDEVTGR